MGDFNLLPNDQLPTQVTISDVTNTEIDYFEQGKKQAAGAAASGANTDLWARLWASMGRGGMYIVGLFAEAVDEVMNAIGKFFKAAQGEKNSAFYDLTATILEDLTGVKVDAAALKQSAFGSGRIAGMEKLGGDLYNILLQEFAPSNGSNVVADLGPAQRFLGFLLNWSIREGNIAVLSEMLPESVDFAKGFREYGTGMARNLGLGRLARRALTPLIQITCANPLTWKLNTQYRPTRLAKEAAIKKYFRSPDFLDKLKQELSEEGFSDDRIQDLIDDARPLTSELDLTRLLFRGGIADPDFTKLMTARGYDANEQFLLTAAQRPVLDRGEIGHLYQHGAISKDDAIGYLGKLGYTPEIAALALQAHSLATVHVPEIHFGELKRLMQENVIDVTEFQDRLAAQGYNTDDVRLLTLDALNGTKGKQKILDLAEIKAAWKAGILPGAQAIADIEKLGYSKDDATLIVATFPTGKKAGSTPPPAPAGSAG